MICVLFCCGLCIVLRYLTHTHSSMANLVALDTIYPKKIAFEYLAHQCNLPKLFYFENKCVSDLDATVSRFERTNPLKNPNTIIPCFY